MGRSARPQCGGTVVAGERPVRHPHRHHSRPRLVMAVSDATVQGAARLGRAIRWPVRDRLFELEVDAEVAELRRHLEVARMRQYRHDLINAFAAVECATTLLAKETLGPSERATVADLLAAGMHSLGGLLSAEPNDHPVSLAEVVRARAHERDGPSGVEADVAPHLMVAGPAAEVAAALDRVVDHARRRNPSGPPTVRGRRHGDRVELWVEDRGPQLTARQRREILTPRRRRLFRALPVGGLDVAVRLVRGHGGEVAVHARPGGGESFVLSWPAADG